jgi:hypothetical protein
MEMTEHILDEIREIDKEIREITEDCRQKFKREFLKEISEKTEELSRQRFNKLHRIVMDLIVDEYMSIDEIAKHLFNGESTLETRNQISKVFKWAMKCETVRQEGNRFMVIPGKWKPSRSNWGALDFDDNFEDRCNYV